MNKDDAVKIISEHMDFLEMVINWEGIDTADVLIEALKCITEEDIKMEKDTNKYYQIKVVIYEEPILDRIKIFLEDANLSYSCTYNPIGQFWNVFIDAVSEAMRKVVYSAIKLFVATERYISGGKLYERMW